MHPIALGVTRHTDEKVTGAHEHYLLGRVVEVIATSLKKRAAENFVHSFAAWSPLTEIFALEKGYPAISSWLAVRHLVLHPHSAFFTCNSRRIILLPWSCRFALENRRLSSWLLIGVARLPFCCS